MAEEGGGRARVMGCGGVVVGSRVGGGGGGGGGGERGGGCCTYACYRLVHDVGVETINREKEKDIGG